MVAVAAVSVAAMRFRVFDGLLEWSRTTTDINLNGVLALVLLVMAILAQDGLTPGEAAHEPERPIPDPGRPLPADAAVGPIVMEAPGSSTGPIDRGPSVPHLDLDPTPDRDLSTASVASAPSTPAAVDVSRRGVNGPNLPRLRAFRPPSEG